MSKQKIFLGLLLFSIVFIVYAFCLKENWFQIDDLGVILNGLIKDGKDFLRVFSEDGRMYASTYNFRLPQPNVVSGFLRPLQNIFFSGIYQIFGLNAYAFFLLQVFFHACNSMLIFLLFSYWLPVSLSFFGGLFCGFFPSLGWMLWLCTLQHALTLFFLLLSILLFISWYSNKKRTLIYWLAGFCFLLSLLARESHVLLAPWATYTVFMFSSAPTFWKKIKEVLAATWIFWGAFFIYVVMRFYAFGLGSLGRTLHNRLIDHPWLAKFFPVTETAVVTAQTSAAPTASTIATTSTIPAAPIAQTDHFAALKTKFFAWTSTVFNMSSEPHILTYGICLFLIIFLLIAYRKNIKLLFYLISSIPLFIWPGILVYPAQRYIHSAYPLFIFIILAGIVLTYKNTKSPFIKWPILTVISFMVGISFVTGFADNIKILRESDPTAFRKRYENFFKENNIPSGSHFIVMSTPEESDLEQLFQGASGDMTIRLALEPISKLSEKGSLECSGDYKIVGVKSTIQPIKNGFRFISNDPQCSWFFHHYQPVRWSEAERAYVRHSEKYHANEWYPCSLGKFYIHTMVDDTYVTDVSFVFDEKWIEPNTIFVTWDTLQGKYVTIDSSHLHSHEIAA